MDTRSKILDTSAALTAGMQAKSEGKRLVISLGTFDPVLESHATRLAGRAAPDAWHVVAVLPGKQPLLPLQARCEVVAALASVDCVVAFEQDPSLLRMVAGKAELHDDREADAEATARLIALIHEKQRLAAAAD